MNSMKTKDGLGKVIKDPTAIPVIKMTYALTLTALGNDWYTQKPIIIIKNP